MLNVLIKLETIVLFKEATFRLRVLRDPVEVNILNENQLVFSATTLIIDILLAEQELRVFKNELVWQSGSSKPATNLIQKSYLYSIAERVAQSEGPYS